MGAATELAPVRRIAPDAYKQLLRVEMLARTAVDPMLLEHARRTVAKLLVADEDVEPATATTGPPTAAAQACIPLTEQFVTYVPGVTEELRAPAREQLGDDALLVFVEALYVVDAVSRLRMVMARLFPVCEDDGAEAAVEAVLPAAGEAAEELAAGLADLHAASMLLAKLDPATTETVRRRCARYHDCKT